MIVQDEYVVDTNGLLRFVDRDHLQHSTMRAAVKNLKAKGATLFMLPQNGIEYWNVATRPKERNGFGYTLTEAAKGLKVLERVFPVLPDTADIYARWKALVKAVGVSDAQVHDARIVAAMKANNITKILTFFSFR